MDIVLVILEHLILVLICRKSHHITLVWLLVKYFHQTISISPMGNPISGLTLGGGVLPCLTLTLPWMEFIVKDGHGRRLILQSES